MDLMKSQWLKSIQDVCWNLDGCTQLNTNKANMQIDGLEM